MKNSLNGKRKLLFLMFWTFIFTGIHAQPNLAFYHFNDQFNSFDYNPAFLTSYEKFTFSIFPLGGSSVGFNNQKLVRDITSKFLTDSVTIQDSKDALNKIVSHPFFHHNAESSLLSFTYRSPIGFFNFRIKESGYVVGSTEGELTKFIFKSDTQSVPPNQIQHLPGQAVHYREYSLGYAYKSRNNRFSAGIRAKMYYGKSAFFSNISGSVHKESDPPNNYVLKTSGSINVSYPEFIYNNTNLTNNTIDVSKSIFNYVMNTNNPGMGVDLGIKYQMMPNLILSVSIIDLGKIKWKTNPNSLNLGRTDTLSSTKLPNTSYYSTIEFGKFSPSKSSFSKPLPATLYAGIKYQVDPIFSIGIADRFVVIKDLSYNSFSVTGKLDVNKILSISTGYSIIANSYLNIPLALLFRGNFGQVYLGTDNFTAIILPNFAEFAGVSVGACFYLFTKRNLHLKIPNYTPFYKPIKTIKNRKTGLTIKANQEY